MSEKQNRGNEDMSKYDSMTTEELEEILRLDAQAPEEQESDTETILYVMEVLAERKRNNGHAGKTAHEAYESFKQNYMPEIDDIQIEYSPNNEKKRLHWLRTLSATAAVLAIIILGSITANAFGINIWEAVVKWTQETFHFGEWGNSDSDNNLPYASLQEALEKGNTPAWLVPTDIPDGFSLTEIQVEQTPLKKTYKSIYTKGNHILKITVRDYLDGDPYYAEQNDGLVEEYTISGITYFIFSNQGQNRVVWLYESYECDISGEVTIDELKEMIESIQKG